MEITTNPQTPTVAPPSLKDLILKTLEREPHRAFLAEDLILLLKLQSPKDPQKQAQTVEQIKSHLHGLVEDGRITEVAAGLFKYRLFFESEKSIEHAFIGGMGNNRYRFHSPIFRLNIGVLSVYFIRDPKKGDWYMTVRDTTIGRDYGLVRRLRDGQYLIGNRPAAAEEKGYIQISGRYIEKEHLTLAISGDEINIEDHNTPNGTRIDLLTKDGLARYQQAAQAFLKAAEPASRQDPVARGRFALEQLLRHHQNLETTFFGAVVDSVLLAG
ncbi:MAG TPA: FHA domain-containing protein [Nitrospiria bacterium]|nr:FHA domain-containing protein [Nitrospiria bacterium]